MLNDKVDFNIKTIHKGHEKVKYRNITTMKFPFDYVLYQMIICELRPDLVIEIGTDNGGSALYLADLMSLIGNGIVHTIDIVNKINPLLPSATLINNHPRIRRFLQGWQGYDSNLTKGFKKVLIIEDGSHHYKDCLGTMQKFAPIVTKNSYLIVEDSLIEAIEDQATLSFLDGGPLRAIREFLNTNKEFIIDRKYCDFFGKNATANVNGYLKKIA